jgi:serine/threonine protein kinase
MFSFSYAMKILKKDKVREQDQVQHTMTERQVLQSVKHPYLVNLKYAFQTEDKLYVLQQNCLPLPADFATATWLWTMSAAGSSISTSSAASSLCLIARDCEPYFAGFGSSS